jgi:hypothetical protein
MYTSQITRSNPSAILFLIDQSGSMTDHMPAGTSKAQYVADVLNRSLYELTVRCTRSDGVRDYFHVGVLGYNSIGIVNGFSGELNANLMHPISEIESNPLRVEERIKKEPDGAGSYYEFKLKFPIWFEPRAEGGTPMQAALVRAAEEISQWCDDPNHMDSFPPTILHITDGESTDGDPEELAKQLQKLSTSDGQVLLFNLHLSSQNTDPILYPADEAALPNQYSKMLFRMSSPLPKQLITYAKDKDLAISNESRGFVFNADAISIVDFFDIGSKAIQVG